MKKTLFIIAALIAAMGILTANCGDSGVNSGGESKYLNMFLDVFSKNPGGDGGGNVTHTLTINVSPVEGTVSRNPDMDSYKAGTQVTVTVTPKDGYEFLGWSGASNSQDAQVTITMNNDKTLGAGFKRLDDDRSVYDVYFNANGAAGGVPPSAVRAVEGKDITLPDEASMEKPGYSLVGWTEDKNGAGTCHYAKSSYTVTRGVTLYAKWVPIHTVTFDGNGKAGGDVPAPVKADSGAAITLPGQGNLTRGGYYFGGWSTSSSGIGDDYGADAQYTVTGDVTLYVRWNEIDIPEYEVAYDGNENTSGSASGSLMYKEGSAINLRAKGDLTRDGYAFAGWTTNPEGAGTVYYEGYTYTVTDKVTFYAKWDALPYYTVMFNGNGQTSGSPPASVSTYSGNNITLPDNGTLVKTGYSFDGWNTISNGTGTNYRAYESYGVKENVTLFAKWTNSAPGVSPTIISTTAASSSSITISWSAVNGATGYNVYRSTSSIDNYTKVASTASTWYTDNNLSLNTTYYYKVSAYNSGGESSPSSYGYATTTTIIAAPGVPTIISTTAVSSSSITISWSAVNGATGYKVYRSASASGNYGILVYTSSSFYTDAELSPGTTYYYKVSAYNDGGESSQSSYSGATTLSVALAAPTGVTATAESASSITVSWSAVNGATGYYVYRSASASGIYSQVMNTTSTSHTDTELSSNTTYYYKVSAYNSSGTSSQSSYVYETTKTTNPTATTYTITTSASPTLGGSVSLSPNQASYTSGTTVTATATAASGYTFTGWSGASTSTSSLVTITMDANKTLTANFQQQPTTVYYTLGFGRNPPSGGTTTPATGQGGISAGTEVNISATPASGYSFNNWTTTSSSSTIANANNASTTVTVNGNVIVTANFSVDVVKSMFTDDRDGKTYETVVLVGQTWMAENLNYETESGSRCYANSADSCGKYGRLYDWNTALTACPAGWRLPDTADWRRLVEVAGGQSSAGSKLKSVTGWNSCCGIVNMDTYGFSALPGGGWSSDGKRVYSTGYNGAWWTATEFGSGNAYLRYMDHYDDGVGEGNDDKSYAFSVRCLED